MLGLSYMDGTSQKKAKHSLALLVLVLIAKPEEEPEDR